MAEEQIVRSLCFMMMPFSKEFKNQWGLAIRPAIEEAGLTAWRGDEDKLGTNIIIHDVTKSINDSVIVIADITGRNPNVMYELGLAHAAKKNVIMLIQNEEEAPFDVSHVRFLRYDPLELTELKDELINRIKNTIKMPLSERPDLFPELKIMSDVEQSELEYLRSRAVLLEVSVFPPTADIFFNNKFVGNRKVTILVNAQASKNTISCVSSDFYEVYIDIENNHLNSGLIEITLDPRDGENIYKRVPQWLRYRRKDPNNPVLMRAIAAYLHEVDEKEEALVEAKELLDLTPGWYVAQNLVGYMLEDVEEKKIYYRKVVSLKPEHYLGYFNLACMAARQGHYQECIDQIHHIINNKECLESYLYLPPDILESDSDFDSIKNDESFSGEFLRQRNELEELRVEFSNRN